MEFQKKINFHDSQLKRIDFENNLESVLSQRANDVHLSFCLVDGNEVSIYLKGLKAFRCEDLSLQNIVSHLHLSSQEGIDVKSLSTWIQWVTSLSDSTSWLKPEKRQEWINAFFSKELELMAIIPSAGAQIVAVCEQIRIE